MRSDRRRGRARALPFALLALALSLSSCVGVDAKAKITADGSGRLELRYAVSKMFVSLGALEANERLIPFPIAREDFDRSIRGVQGLKLEAYSQKETENDLMVEVVLAFESPAALAAFLDPKGELATYSEASGERRLSLLLSRGKGIKNQDTERLLAAAFAPYQVSISFELPSAARSPGIGQATRGGTLLSYSAATSALAVSRDPIRWDIIW